MTSYKYAVRWRTHLNASSHILLCIVEMAEVKRKDEGWPLTSDGDYDPEQSIDSQLAERRERDLFFGWL